MIRFVTSICFITFIPLLVHAGLDIQTCNELLNLSSDFRQETVVFSDLTADPFPDGIQYEKLFYEAGLSDEALKNLVYLDKYQSTKLKGELTVVTKETTKVLEFRVDGLTFSILSFPLSDIDIVSSYEMTLKTHAFDKIFHLRVTKNRLTLYVDVPYFRSQRKILLEAAILASK